MNINPNTIYNQSNNHDNVSVIAHHQVEHLYQENKEVTQKLIETQQSEIKFLRELLGKSGGR